MSTIVHLALKDLRLLWRDKGALFWVLFFPLVQAVLWGIISSGGGPPRGIKLAIVDEDKTTWSVKFADAMTTGTATLVSRPPNADAARDLVRKGKVSAALLLRPGFGEALGPEMFFGDQGMRMDILVDPSRGAETGMLQGVLMERLFLTLKAKFLDPALIRAQVRRALDEIDKDPDFAGTDNARLLRDMLGTTDKFLADVEQDFYRRGILGTAAGGSGGGDGGGMLKLPITEIARDDSRPRSAYDITFPAGMMWGVIGACASFALGLVIERTQGTMARLQVSPAPRAVLLAGKGLACFLASGISMVLLLVVGTFAFKLRIGSPAGFALAWTCTALCFVGVMMFLSTLGRTERAVGGAAWGVLLISAMFGGGMIPLFMMPPWMQTVSNASPVKWGIYALEGAIWRGFSPAEMLFPCAVLIGIGVAGFAVGVRRLAAQDR